MSTVCNGRCACVHQSCHFLCAEHHHWTHAFHHEVLHEKSFKPGRLTEGVEWLEKTMRKYFGVEQDPGTILTTLVTQCQHVITQLDIFRFGDWITHLAWVQSKQGKSYLSTPKSHTYPKNQQFPLHLRQAGSHGQLLLIFCLHATGTKILNPILTVHYLHSQDHLTYCHHTIGSGSCQRQQAVRIWSRHYHKFCFLAFFRCIESTTLRP